MPASPEEISANDLPVAGELDRGAAAGDLLLHSRGDKRLAGGQVGDSSQVSPVADDDLALGDGGLGAVRTVGDRPGAYSDHKQFSAASATVTFLYFCLGSNSVVLLPASSAAGSATAGRPTLDWTNRERPKQRRQLRTSSDETNFSGSSSSACRLDQARLVTFDVG